MSGPKLGKLTAFLQGRELLLREERLGEWGEKEIRVKWKGEGQEMKSK